MEEGKVESRMERAGTSDIDGAAARVAESEEELSESK